MLQLTTAQQTATDELMTALGLQKLTAEQRKISSAQPYVDGEVAVLRGSDENRIKAGELNVQVCNVAEQLALNRCPTAVRRH